MADYIDVTCDDGTVYRWYRPMAQGPAHTLTPEEQSLDDHGLTNVNLHRRIDPQAPTDPVELAPREYKLSVNGVESYRMTQITTHDEDSTTCEIP